MAQWLNPQVDSPPFAATVAAAARSIVLPGRPGPPTIGLRQASQGLEMFCQWVQTPVESNVGLHRVLMKIHFFLLMSAIGNQFIDISLY